MAQGAPDPFFATGREHRCTDGTWQPGKVRDCEECKPKRTPPSVKRSAES